MSGSPDVSVVIPTFNRAGVISRAVQSVLDQSGADCEVIVVDDGSTDDTEQALAGIRDCIGFIKQPQMGVSAARNHGIRQSQGKLIAFLDSDDYWLPGKLEAQVRFFRKHPESLICQTDEIWIRNGRRVNSGHRHQKPSGDIFIPSLELCLVSPSAVMMRRELFNEVGLFDESFPACEDYDLWLRVAARFEVHLIPESLIVKTGGHADQLSRTIMGLDRYRVRALEKIIHSGLLDDLRTAAAKEHLYRKALVYGQGCLKRGRDDEGTFYLNMAERYRTDGALIHP